MIELTILLPPSSDSKYIASASIDMSVKVFEIETGKEVWTSSFIYLFLFFFVYIFLYFFLSWCLSSFLSFIHSFILYLIISFLPSFFLSFFLPSFLPSFVPFFLSFFLWKVRTLHGHTKALTSVVLSRDGTRVVTGSLDETAKIRDAGQGSLLFDLKGHSER